MNRIRFTFIINLNMLRKDRNYEIYCIYYKDVFGIPPWTYMSSTFSSIKNKEVWALAFSGGFVHSQVSADANGSRAVRCIKR